MLVELKEKYVSYGLTADIIIRSPPAIGTGALKFIEYPVVEPTVSCVVELTPEIDVGPTWFAVQLV